MRLSVYIYSASDGHFQLKAPELPELTAEAWGMGNIPGPRAAAAALTGRKPTDFDITLDY